MINTGLETQAGQHAHFTHQQMMSVNKNFVSIDASTKW